MVFGTHGVVLELTLPKVDCERGERLALELLTDDLVFVQFRVGEEAMGVIASDFCHFSPVFADHFLRDYHGLDLFD